MAFVFRSQVDPYPKSHTPPPTQYEPQLPNKLPRPVSVPFNQSSPRNIWDINNIPGPGAYEPALDASNDRLVVQQNGKIFLINRKSESFNFKSGCQRFKEVEQKLPGPGQYDTSQLYAKKEFNKKQREKSANSHQNSLQKYLLMTHNTKPEKEHTKLQIILDDEAHSSNQNQVQKLTMQKKAVPFNSSVERTIKIRPQTSLGPGSYNICDTPKTKDNLRLKASYSLAKFKKIIVTQDQQQKYEPKMEKFATFSKEEKKTQETRTNASKFKKKDDFFGSTVGRFYTTQNVNTPGPGAYQLVSDQNKIKKDKSKLAFGRVATPEKTQFTTIVSPFVVAAETDKKVEKKSVDKKSWNFGSNEPRFREKSNQKVGPLAEYASLKICVGGKAKHNKVGSYNKENLKLKLRTNNHSNPITVNQQKHDERPLCYAASANTISHKVGRKQQVNAPFSTQVTRFAQIDKEMNIIEDLLSQNQQQAGRANRVKEKIDPRGFMDSNNPRFNYKHPDDGISPCSYDPVKPIRKEFNKLFL